MRKLLLAAYCLATIGCVFFIVAALLYNEYSQVADKEQKCEEAASMILNETNKEQQMYEYGRLLIDQNQASLAVNLVDFGLFFALVGGALYELNFKRSWFAMSK